MPLKCLVLSGVVLVLSACSTGSMTPNVSSPNSLTRGTTVRTVAVTSSVTNGPIEPAYFNGRLYEFHIASVTSQNKNEFVSGCFNLGPINTGLPHGPMGQLYALFVTGATMHSCPDGSNLHDHLLSAVPGSPGYHPLWQVLIVVDGPNPDPSIIPIKSVAALQAAVAAGQVAILSFDGTIIEAPVVGPAGSP